MPVPDGRNIKIGYKTRGGIMRIPTIYLETTIFNFPFVDDAPQYKADTLRLFAEIKAGNFKPYTSEYVTEELENTNDAVKLQQMKALIADCGITVIPVSNEVGRLADVYVTTGIIPKRFVTDALHIAAATVTGLDFIVSLNFRHIVKRKTIEEAELINFREGYKKIGIYSPAEVIDYGEND
jgi:predicted nucleic acid-binding protein